MRDVIIVGAGPAGSSAAAALSQQGWDVLLLEKDHFPRHKVCGEFLSPESQQSLAASSLLGEIDALRPHPIRRARLVSRRGAELTVDLPGTAQGVSRWAMDHALAAGAQRHGSTLREGARVVRTEYCGDDYTVEVQGGYRLRSRSLLFACGRHSASALPPHAGSPPRHRRHMGAKMHYRNLTPSDQVELFFFSGGYCGINSVEEEMANVCLLCSYDAFSAAGRSVEGIIAMAAAENPALARRLAGATPIPESGCAVAPVDLFRPPAAWSDGAPALGDTAAMIPPLCGDGMAMALRSADLCTPLVHEFLHGTLSVDELSRRYTKLWKREFETRLRVGGWLQRLLDRGALTEVLLQTGNHLPHLAHQLVQATRGQVQERSDR